MKSTNTTQPKAQNRAAQQKGSRPEIRDNLDSRKNEEYEIKGDDVTHNKKDHHNENKKENK